MSKGFLPAAPEQNHVVGGTVYRGANPQFRPILNAFGMVVGWTKTHRGVPFRRIGYAN